MAEAKDVAEAEAFAVLAAGMARTTIYQDAPEDAPFPLTVLGDSTSSPIGGKGDIDERVSIDVVNLVSAEEKAPLSDLQGQVKALLRDHKATRDGFELHFLFENDDARLHENGKHYVGISTFTVMAFAS